MRRSIVFGITVAAALAAATSCVIPFMIQEDPWWGRGGNAFRRTVPVEPGSAILLENEAGNVEINGWDRNEAEILAESGWGRLPGSGFGFGSWGRGAAPDVEIDKLESLLKIKTRASGRADIVRPVNFAISVPRSIQIQDLALQSGDLSISDIYGKIKADVEDGNVRIANFSGSVDLLAGRGRVEVELLDLRSEDEVSLTVKDGDLTVYIQPEASVKIEAVASNGEITSEFELGQALPAKKITASIGKAGGSVLSLTAFRGDIHLKRSR
jgi:hypothetical protein